MNIHNHFSNCLLLLIIACLLSWTESPTKDSTKSIGSLNGEKEETITWAERLGYPKGKKVVILHADDIGMCPEANISAKRQLLSGNIQSCAVMMPCENAKEFIEWAKMNPDQDIGLHLTLTSEWQKYRWPGITGHENTPGLHDEQEKLWHKVIQVALNASPTEVEEEIRAQMNQSIEWGYRPDHIDTHMGTLYSNPKFTAAYLKMAEEFNIPAMVLDFNNPAIVEGFRAEGYPIDDEMIQVVNNYKLPKLDFFSSAPKGKTYEEKISKFKELILSVPPGLTEIIFHPSELTDNLKTITGSWQQRSWEAQMFADPDLIQFFKDQDLIFTNWKEIMKRFETIQSEG
ncbi:MAG: putative glycoside hydrolase/deacetylase ChbG (UPF0249 family) [Saprospiraceae bacterium]|jgi:predicted glycoside hydrolase/deacetylase ChbG (UPF0249 family)